MSTETLVKPDQFEILDDQNRMVSGWASIQVLDKQNDIVPVAEMQKGMLTLMDRGANIIYGHSNKPVGKVLQWETKMHPIAKTLGIHLMAKFFKDYPVDDIVWDKVKKGELTGFSIGATAREEKRTLNEGVSGLSKEVGVLHDISLMEISVVERPANQLALIDEINYFAKGETEVAKDGYIGGSDGNIMNGKAGKPIKPAGEVEVKKPKTVKKKLDFDYLADNFSKSWQKEKKEHSWLSEAQAKRVDADHKKSEGVADVDNSGFDIRASAGSKRSKKIMSVKNKGFGMWVEVGKATRKIKGMKSIQSLAKKNRMELIARNGAIIMSSKTPEGKKVMDDSEVNDKWRDRNKVDEELDGKCPKCGKPYSECECGDKKKSDVMKSEVLKAYCKAFPEDERCKADKDDKEEEEREGKRHEERESPRFEAGEEEEEGEEEDDDEGKEKKKTDHKFACPECMKWHIPSKRKTFINQGQLDRHMKVMHQKKEDIRKDLRCPRCGKMIPEARYNQHLSECQGSTEKSLEMIEAVKECSKKVKRCVSDVKGSGEKVNPYAVCNASVKKAMDSCEKMKAKSKAFKPSFKAGLDNKQIPVAGGDVGNATLMTSYKADETVETVDPDELRRKYPDKLQKLSEDSVDMMSTVKKAVDKKKARKKIKYREAKSVLSNLENNISSVAGKFVDDGWKQRNKEMEEGSVCMLDLVKKISRGRGNFKPIETRGVGNAGKHRCKICQGKFKTPDQLAAHSSNAHGDEGALTRAVPLSANRRMVLNRLNSKLNSGQLKLPKRQPHEAKKPKQHAPSDYHPVGNKRAIDYEGLARANKSEGD